MNPKLYILKSGEDGTSDTWPKPPILKLIVGLKDKMVGFLEGPTT